MLPVGSATFDVRAAYARMMTGSRPPEGQDCAEYYAGGRRLRPNLRRIGAAHVNDRSRPSQPGGSGIISYARAGDYVTGPRRVE
jgi:hypothetical protein